MVFTPHQHLVSGPAVTAIVGKDRRPFVIHRALLCDRSAHFRAALLGQFQEAHTGVIELPDVEETIFEIFVGWLYGGTPMCQRSTAVRFIIELMCFARTILLEELQNDCMDAIRRYFRARRGESAVPVVTAEVVALAYNAVPELPTLRLLVCLEAALQLRCKNRIELTDSADRDRDLFELVEQGGDFASDFTRLLVFPLEDDSVTAGITIPFDYDCMYHAHRTSETCQVMGDLANDVGAALIVGARGYLATKQTPTTSE
ncbi:MAG: hypothetical protein Q9221_006886 [Calogaya cf. arnoldii]